MVSHELRTPLVPMKVVFRRGELQPKILGVLNEKQKRAVEGIDKSILKQEESQSKTFWMYQNRHGPFASIKKQEIDIFQFDKRNSE